MSHRKYSARVFTRAGMLCPHCRAKFEHPEESCSHCEFDLSVCEKAFPFSPPPLTPIIDPSGLVPAGLNEDLAKATQKLRKRFPKIEISFCFVRLQPGVATQEFAFWLHNSAPHADETRAWHLLVVGDFTSGQLALSAGYGLEPYIKNDLWEAALQELAACIADEEWKEGLNGFVADARTLLTAAWNLAEQRRLKNHRKLETHRTRDGQSERPESSEGDEKSDPERSNTEELAKS